MTDLHPIMETALWHYSPDDGSGLRFEVICRVVGSEGGRRLIEYIDSSGEIRQTHAHSADVTSPKPNRLENIFESEFEDRLFAIFEATIGAGRLFCLVWKSDQDLSPRDATSISFYQSFQDAAASFPGWEKLPFYTPKFIDSGYETVVAEHIEHCLAALGEDREIYSHVRGLGPFEWVHTSRASIEKADPLNEDEISREDAQALRHLGGEAISGLSAFNHKRLPKLIGMAQLDEFGLETRTYNVACREGWLANPSLLQGKYIGELLRLQNFGRKSVLNLILELEQYLPPREGVANGQQAHEGPSLRWPEIEDLFYSGMKFVREFEDASVDRDDLRFGPLVRKLDPQAKSLDEALRKILPAEACDLRETRERLRIAGDVASVIREAQESSLEVELLSIIKAAGFDGRNQSLISCRLGFSGQSPATLEMAGERFEMTRERVRQIVAKFDEALEDSSVFVPVLRKTIARIAEMLPAPVTKVEEELRATAAANLSIEGIAAAGKLFAVSPTLSISPSGFVETKGEAQLVSRLISRIRREVRKEGIGRFRQIAEDCGVPLSDQALMREALVNEDGFFWVDEEAEIFWLRDITHSKYLGVLQKILAVCDSASAATLSSGIKRFHRTENFNLTERQVLSWCEGLPFCSVAGEIIHNCGIEREEALSESEMVLYDVLRVCGGKLATDEFERRCKERGVGRQVFYSALSYSPILEKIQRGVYGIRGWTDTPKTTYAACDITPEGRLWACVQLAPPDLNSTSLSMPFGIQLPSGQYRMDNHVLDIRTNDKGSTEIDGLEEILRSHSASPGQYLTILCDTARSIVTALVTQEPADPAELEMFEAFLNPENPNGLEAVPLVLGEGKSSNLPLVVDPDLGIAEQSPKVVDMASPMGSREVTADATVRPLSEQSIRGDSFPQPEPGMEAKEQIEGKSLPEIERDLILSTGTGGNECNIFAYPEILSQADTDGSNQAINALKGLLKIPSESAKAANTLGLWSLRQGNLQQAMNLFKYAIKAKPDLMWSYVLMAKTYMAADMFSEAADRLTKIVRVSESSPHTHLLLSLCDLHLKRSLAAKQNVQIAAQLGADESIVRAILGEISKRIL